MNIHSTDFNSWHDTPPRKYLYDPVPDSFDDMKALFNLFKRGANEREVDALLRKRPTVLGCASALFKAGHHGVWVIPQVVIKPPSIDGTPGMIPDYLIAARCSDGIYWWILELKRPDMKLYKIDKEGKAIPTADHTSAREQLERYQQFCCEHNDYIHDVLGIKSFCRPKAVLLIGRERELIDDDRKRQAKRLCNEKSSGYEIRTWDSLLREIRRIAVCGSWLKHLSTYEMELRLDDELDSEEFIYEKE